MFELAQMQPERVEFSGGGMGSIVVVLFFLIAGAISLAGLALWVWMIIDCATNEKSEGNEKLIWILIIVLANWIGALIYLLVRRPQRIKQFGH